jgi:hypothetical protein
LNIWAKGSNRYQDLKTHVWKDLKEKIAAPSADHDYCQNDEKRELDEPVH